MVVSINLWFIPRSRSTVLLRALSQLPNSTTFFEPLLYAHYFGDGDRDSNSNPEALFDGVKDGVNWESAIRRIHECKSEVRIVKDFGHILLGRHADVITDDSINIFLIRHPKFVFTSKTNSEAVFYHVPNIYGDFMETIKYVEANCVNSPIIIDSSLHLSSKDGFAYVVKTICNKAGLPFKDSMLTWSSRTDLDSKWVIPAAANETNEVLGTHNRANASTCFEDKEERKADMEQLLKKYPYLEEDYHKCTKYYEQIMKHVCLLSSA